MTTMDQLDDAFGHAAPTAGLAGSAGAAEELLDTAEAGAPPVPASAAVASAEDDELLEGAAEQPKAGRAARPRIREFEAIVEEAIRETPDTTTLVYFTGSDRMEYEAGQFLTIRPHQFPALDRFVKFFED